MPDLRSDHRRPALLIAFAISACAFFGPRASGAESPSNWDFPEFIHATEAYRKGDCQTAWELMWPLAKTGKYEAIYFLRSSLVDKMVPPGRAKSSPASATWHMLTLAAYAAAGPKGHVPFHGDPNHRWAKKEIPILIAQLNLGDAGKRVAQCYESDSSFKQCLNLAVETKVVQRFEDYAAAVDSEVHETGNRASCLPRH